MRGARTAADAASVEADRQNAPSGSSSAARHSRPDKRSAGGHLGCRAPAVPWRHRRTAVPCAPAQPRRSGLPAIRHSGRSWPALDGWRLSDSQVVTAGVADWFTERMRTRGELLRPASRFQGVRREGTVGWPTRRARPAVPPFVQGRRGQATVAGLPSPRIDLRQFSQSPSCVGPPGPWAGVRAWPARLAVVRPDHAGPRKRRAVAPPST
jgi:hypothetical protein